MPVSCCDNVRHQQETRLPDSSAERITRRPRHSPSKFIPRGGSSGQVTSRREYAVDGVLVD